jgi:hypothetical protein
VHDGPDAPDRLVSDWSTVRSRRLHVEGQAADEPVVATVAITIEHEESASSR